MIQVLILAVVLSFGLGMYAATAISRETLCRKNEDIRRLTVECDKLQTALRADPMREYLMQLGGRAAKAEQLVNEIADGIDHACDAHAGGNAEEGWYAIYVLDDRLKLLGIGPKPKAD